MSLDTEDFDLFKDMKLQIMGIEQNIDELNKLLEQQNQILLQLIETLKWLK